MNSDDDMLEANGMDSDDDMLEANGSESVDEDFYGADNDDDIIDNNSDDSDDFISSRHQLSYTILSEADIRSRQEEDIMRVSNVLSVSPVLASILLRQYNWSVSKVHDEWFANEDKVRKVVGLLEKPVLEFPDAMEITCGICFERYPREMINSAACGHPFCTSCWAGYISTSINDGHGCLMMRCPDPSCGAAVGQDMVDMLTSEEDREKYSRYLLRSYVEDNRKIKWCPTPGCDYAVHFAVGSGNYDVLCRCSYGFCWNCMEEAHRPVDCGTMEKWILKNSAESENMNWLRLGTWSVHGARTGGFSACNRYEKAIKKGVSDETEKRREMAKNSLERYSQYYERWATNHSSRQKAIADLEQMQNLHLKKLSDIQCKPESQLKFIIEAWLQIVECRRVLKWTYAYGFYLPEHEHAKRQLFEYLQGEAESSLERLHQCAEKELQVYQTAVGPLKDFNEFRRMLAVLTSVTRNYFKNLVRGLENGLSVDSHGASSRSTSSKSLGGGRGKALPSRSIKGTTDDATHWSCEHCTSANLTSTNTCQMCQNQCYPVHNSIRFGERKRKHNSIRFGERKRKQETLLCNESGMMSIDQFLVDRGKKRHL